MSPLPSSSALVALRQQARLHLLGEERLRSDATAKIHQWAEAETDPSEIVRLLHESRRRDGNRRVLLRVRGECIRPLLNHCLFAPHHRWSDLLLENPHWTSGHSEHLRERLLKQLESHLKNARGGTSPLLDQLVQLDAKSRVLQESDFATLIRGTGALEGSSAMSPPQLELASFLLARYSERLGEHFLPLYEHWLSRSEHGAYGSTVPPLLIRSPHTPHPVLRSLALEYNPHFTHRALARSERALADPEIRLTLLTSPDPTAVDLLFSQLSPDPAQAFRELAARNPEGAARQLDRLPVTSSLEREDLLPLLSSPEAQTRLRAMTWWGNRQNEPRLTSSSPQR